MKEHVYRFISAVFLTILALMGIAAVLHILVTLPLGEKQPEWLGAFGTVATLSITIWLATAQARSKNREQRDAALVAAASILIRLRNLIRALAHMRELLRVPFETRADAYVAFADWSKFIRDDDIWSDDELVPLIYLPGHTAATLAMLRTNIKTTKTRIAKMAEDPEREHYSDDVIIRGLRYEVSATLDEINSAYAECVNFLLKHGFDKAVPRYNPAYERPHS